MRVFLHGLPRAPERFLRGVKVATFAQQKPQSLQRLRGNAVALGCRIVREWFRPMHQLLVIVGGKIESAIGFVVEMLQEKFG